MVQILNVVQNPDYLEPIFWSLFDYGTRTGMASPQWKKWDSCMQFKAATCFLQFPGHFLIKYNFFYLTDTYKRQCNKIHDTKGELHVNFCSVFSLKMLLHNLIKTINLNLIKSPSCVLILILGVWCSDCDCVRKTHTSG